MIPQILQQLGGGLKIPQQILQMVRMIKNGDTQGVLNLLQTNPNMQQVAKIIERHGGDSMKAFRATAEEMGMDADEILGMMK